MQVDVEGELAFLELAQGDTRVSLRQEGDGPVWSTEEAPAGDGYLVVTGMGAYTLRLPGARMAPAQAQLALELVMPADGVAAWWPEGQRLEGIARLTNHDAIAHDVRLDPWTSHDRWRVSLSEGAVTVEPGATVGVPVTVEILPEAWADVPVAIGVRATGADTDPVSATITLTPTGDAVPVGGYLAWDVPDSFLGGLDVASAVLGGVSDGSIDPVAEAMLHDGQSIGGGGMALPVTDPPTPTTVDLAGEDAQPVVGVIIDPASGLDALSRKPRGFELWLSEDGATWTSALVGELTPQGFEQAFELPSAMPARYARLAITSTWAATILGPAQLSPDAWVAEWKVIAAPGSDPAGEQRDLADPVLGGHVVTSEPLFSELPEVVQGVLDADLTGAWIYPPEGSQVTWVVGFLHDRAAQVTELRWQDPSGSDPASRARRVSVEVSTRSPLGPWEPLGTWDLERADDGSVSPLTLASPTWARYLRFTARGPRTEGAAWELPGRMSILERPTDATYRSILAEWGQSRPVGPFELLEPRVERVALDDPDVGEGADARPLEAGTTTRGRVAIGADVDEYRIDVPDGQRSLRIEVGGEPVVGVRLQLLAPDGTDVPLAFTVDATSGQDVYLGNVEPGTGYRLRVEQPPFSAVLMYDTSLSIAAYWRPIVQGLMAFAGDVQRGRDRVMIIPFGVDARPVLRDWSDDAWQLLAALEGNFADGDSSVEASVLNALEVLAARQGARAILLVTDGETASFRDGPEMWRGLTGQRPLVYAVHIGGTAGTMGSTQLLQDLAGSAGGAYAYVRTQDEMDRAFDRMATSLRRPAGYRLSYVTSTDELPPPEPGSLGVVTQPGPDGEPVAAPIDPRIAVEIILDTSGSMRGKLGGTTRIAAAKEVLTRLVREELPPGIPVALRVFRAEDRSCDTELAVPLGPLDVEAMVATIEALRTPRTVRTPLAAAIERVADDLAGVTGPRVVVVVSDGRESCDGDPEAAVRALRDEGFDVTVNVVGLGLNKADRRRIRRLATLGGGSYFDAQGAGQLDDAIASAVSAPYEVRDATGTVVGRGIVNGRPLEMPPGTYQVTVLTDPPYEFEAVVVGSGDAATLTLPSGPATP
jgi:Mg-chelatase subunit ChlD